MSQPFKVGEIVHLQLTPRDWDRLKTSGLRGMIRITVGGVSVLITTPVKLLARPSVRLKIKTVVGVQ